MKRNNMCPFCFIKSLFQKKKPTSVNPQLPDYENGVALTPPMGWSSWNTFRNRINEKLILDTAEAMKDNGLGGKDAFDETILGANGQVQVEWNGTKYDVYGELITASGELFYYVS